MSNKIKCTYDDCFKHFKTKEAMKKHKVKDPHHFYCKRCDVDCEDDTEYLIHQIVSSKHIACPECGEEFEGGAARDLHVDVRHKKKQILTCVGCNTQIGGASGYMAHIGKGQCEVITLEAFDRLRAERQVLKERWEDVLDTNNVPYRDSSMLASDADTTGGAPLMDDDLRGTTNGTRTTSDLDARISPLQPTTSASQQSTSKFTSSTANLSIDRYPPLPPQSQASQNNAKKDSVPPNSTAEVVDLLDLEETEVRSHLAPKSQQQKTSAWTSTSTASRGLFPVKREEEKAYLSPSDISGTPTEPARSAVTDATYGNDTQLRDSDNMTGRTPLPGAARPPNYNPNAPFQGVQTAAPKVMPQSILDPQDYFDDIQNKFICPARDCKRHFAHAEGFKAHFITNAHVGGKTQCPSCLKKFLTTWALIAHCESPSRKCRISKSANYNQILRDLTAGLLGTEGHIDDNSDVRYVVNPVDRWVEPTEENYW